MQNIRNIFGPMGFGACLNFLLVYGQGSDWSVVFTSCSEAVPACISWFVRRLITIPSPVAEIFVRVLEISAHYIHVILIRRKIRICDCISFFSGTKSYRLSRSECISRQALAAVVSPEVV